MAIGHWNRERFVDLAFAKTVAWRLLIRAATMATTAQINRTAPGYIHARLITPKQHRKANDEEYNAFAYAAWVRRLAAASVGAALGMSVAALTVSMF